MRTTSSADLRTRTFIQNMVAILVALLAIVALFYLVQRSRNVDVRPTTESNVEVVSPAPAPVPMAQYEILYAEDFNSRLDSWGLSPVQASYEGQALLLEDNLMDGYAWARPYLQFDNFIVEAYGRWLGGAVGGGYGIEFRVQDELDDFYAFYVHNDGHYTVSRNVSGTWVNLAEGFSSAIDRQGGINLLRIEARGDHFRFFVNNSYLVDVIDGTLDKGDVRLAARKVEGTEYLLVAFDNFIIARYVERQG